MHQKKEMMPIVPGVNRRGVCLGCPDRQVGCHGTCEEYLSFAEKNKKRREAAMAANKGATDAIMTRFHRFLKRFPEKTRGGRA